MLIINHLSGPVIGIAAHWNINDARALVDLAFDQRNIGFTDCTVMEQAAQLTLHIQPQCQQHHPRSMAIQPMYDPDVIDCLLQTCYHAILPVRSSSRYRQQATRLVDRNQVPVLINDFKAHG